MPYWLMHYDAGTRAILWSPLLILTLVLGFILLHLFEPKSRSWVWKVLAGVAVVMFLIQPYLALVWSPPEKYMGDVYRILYMHVPQVDMAMIGLTINFGCSIAYLFKKSWTTDALAEASAEVGVYFGVVGVLLGSIWGKPTWNTYWTWDPRLTTAAIMLVIYVGYLTMRNFMEDPEKRATFGAVLGIIAYVDIPVMYMSVRWWHSIHQQPSNPRTVDSLMVVALRWSLVAFLSLFVPFLYVRFKQAVAKRKEEVALPESLPAKEAV